MISSSVNVWICAIHSSQPSGLLRMMISDEIILWVDGVDGFGRLRVLPVTMMMLFSLKISNLWLFGVFQKVFFNF